MLRMKIIMMMMKTAIFIFYIVRNTSWQYKVLIIIIIAASQQDTVCEKGHRQTNILCYKVKDSLLRCGSSIYKITQF